MAMAGVMRIAATAKLLSVCRETLEVPAASCWKLGVGFRAVIFFSAINSPIATKINHWLIESKEIKKKIWGNRQKPCS